jgi:hypothetical protein
MPGSNIDEDESRKRYGQPFTSKHPVPTVKKYREEQQHRQEASTIERDEESTEDKVRRAYDTAKGILTGDDGKGDQDPYPSANRNLPTEPQKDESKQNGHQYGRPKPHEPDQANEDPSKAKEKKQDKQKDKQSATENAASETDPRKKRKAMKKNKRTDGGREVTDPVTHLPVVIYDSTPKDLKRTKENYPAFGSTPRTATGLSAASKDQDQLDEEEDETQRVHDGTQKLFPPPSFDDVKRELTSVHRLGFTVGLGLVAASAVIAVAAGHLVGDSGSHWRSPLFIASLLTAAGSFAAVQFVQNWIGKKVEDLWEDEVWDSARDREQQSHEEEAIIPESVAWMNSLLTSVWPLINPDLFTSLADSKSMPELVVIRSLRPKRPPHILNATCSVKVRRY